MWCLCPTGKAKGALKLQRREYVRIVSQHAAGIACFGLRFCEMDFVRCGFGFGSSAATSTQMSSKPGLKFHRYRIRRQATGRLSNVVRRHSSSKLLAAALAP